MLPLSYAIYPKVFSHFTFFALASILSVQLKRNSSYSYIAFCNIPGMDALANPSVLVTQALVDGPLSTHVRSLVVLTSTASNSEDRFPQNV